MKRNHLIIAFTLSVLAIAGLAISGESNQQQLFTGFEDHSISLEEAIEYVTRYQADDNGKNYGGYFGSEAIRQILDQDDCVGFRYYYARDENGNKCLVVVGVDRYGTDMVNGHLAERTVICPPVCPNESPLKVQLGSIAHK